MRILEMYIDPMLILVSAYRFIRDQARFLFRSVWFDWFLCFIWDQIESWV